jgi:hypothetical protein
MKKLLISMLIILLIAGCSASIGPTPTTTTTYTAPATTTTYATPVSKTTVTKTAY